MRNLALNRRTDNIILLYVKIRRLAAEVVIIGSGGAGMAAALEATRLGADVLMLEKAPWGLDGGNTRVSSQGFVCPTDPAAAMTYLTALASGSSLNPAKVRLWAEAACQNSDWLGSFGIPTERLPDDQPHAEYPELPGATAIVKRRVCREPHVDLWHSLKVRVQSAAINVAYGLRAIRLKKAQDSRVTQVWCVDSASRSVEVSARKGVILACGGYAASRLHLSRYSPKFQSAETAGCPHNVGDGLTMCAELGARFSGLDAVAGPYLAFRPPGYRTTVPVEPLVRKPGRGQPGRGQPGRFAIIDERGKRLRTDYSGTRHGWVTNANGHWEQLQPPPANVYFLCDNELLSRTPLVSDTEKARTSGWCRAMEGLRWSPDNHTELQLGWITSPRTGSPYQLPLVPSILNTQGGPERNELCQVIDRSGMPLPGLYSAGELGSIFPGLYQGSGNLADCLVSGRIAARSALGRPPADT